MSTMFISSLDNNDWWEQLGLMYSGISMERRHEFYFEEVVIDVLRDRPPIAFAGVGSEPPLGLEEMTALIKAKAKEAQRAHEEEHRQKAEDRRNDVKRKVEDAFARPDAAEVIADGQWAGFTKGDAVAWSWVLFQYEPRGLMFPGSQVRHESLQKLERGELPAVFGYPKRAAELAAKGLDARKYRLHQEALGASTYDPADVRRG